MQSAKVRKKDGKKHEISQPRKHHEGISENKSKKDTTN